MALPNGKERTQLIIIDHEKARLLTEVTPLYLNADLKQESPIPHGAGDSFLLVITAYLRHGNRKIGQGLPERNINKSYSVGQS